MRSIVFRSAMIVAVVSVLSNGCAAARQPAEPPSAAPAMPDAHRTASLPDEDVAGARERLTDLLASEGITRIDFEAETYEQAMNNLHVAVETIIELNRAGASSMTALVGQASQVIEAFDAHSPRGLLTTFGKSVKTIRVSDSGEARMLGELMGRTTSLIREQLGESVAYRDPATKLFRSVLLDPEGDTLLVQYLEGIQRIADLPRGKRGRYFQ